MSTLKITEKDIGRKVLLKDNTEGIITIFDGSNAPVFVRHKNSEAHGTWHFDDGKAISDTNSKYTIICFLDEPIAYSRNKCYSHNWKYYLGLSESFYYCTKCDAKREKE